MKGLNIRNITKTDWLHIRTIYEQGIATGLATFETEAPSWKEWDNKMLASCRLVAEREGRVLGWSALSTVSGRWVYRGVAEVSVYVAESQRGQGIALLLLQELIKASEKEGLWTLQASIFPENTASINIHKKAGFRIVGYREQIGQLRGVWKDTVLMERRTRTLEC